ncbi:MAG: hypothetical protein O9320_14035 [Magnetospirillum sp.]|nr:hypothetical protein [Magnetospirillum sp.]
MAKPTFWQTTPARELIKWAIWYAVTFPALWMLMSLARLIWVGSESLIDQINDVEKAASVQAWATLAGSFGGAFLAGLLAVGSFMLQRWWHRQDTEEKVRQLLRRALPRHISPPWILEFSFVPLAENLANARHHAGLRDMLADQFPCAFDLSERVEGSIATEVPDIIALIHDIKKSRESLVEAVQRAKTQRLEGSELHFQRCRAMNALMDIWVRNHSICQELIKRDVIAIDQFEENAKRVFEKLIALYGKAMVFQMTPPEASPLAGN